MKIFCYMILFTNYHKIKLINQQKKISQKIINKQNQNFSLLQTNFIFYHNKKSSSLVRICDICDYMLRILLNNYICILF